MSNPIIESPLNTIVSGDNGTTTISAKIKSSNDYLYQWSVSDSEKTAVSPRKFETIPNATGTNLVLNNTDNNHNNWYRLSVTDKITNDQYLTSPFQFGVLPDPSYLNVTGAPLYVYANNKQAQLQVLPSSSYTYIWKKKEITHDERLNLDKYVDVSSGPSNILNLTDLSIADTYSIYKVTVSGQGGETWTSPPITMIYDPSITIIQENLIDFYLPNNGNHQLYAVARSSNGTLLYKWQKSVKGESFQDIPGETKNVLNLSGLNENSIGDKYRLAISSRESKNNFKYSSTATILAVETVLNCIDVLDENIPDVLYMTDAGVSIEIDASSSCNTNNTTYQWFKSTDKINWTSVSSLGNSDGGAYMSSSVSIPFTNFSDKQEYYRVKFTDTDFNAAVWSKIFTVDYNPTTYMTQQPNNLTTTNGSGTLTCQFFQNQTGLYDYAWYRLPMCGTDILEKSNAPSSTTRNNQFLPFYTSSLQLSNMNVLNNDKDRYVFIAKDKATENIAVISKQAQVNVPNTLTVTSGLPDYIRIPDGDSGTLSVTINTTSPKASPNPPITYQWSESVDNGLTFNNIIGATGSSLSLSNVSSGDNKKYFRVTVQDSINTLVLK